MDPTVLQQTPLQPSPGIGDGSKSERTPLALRVFGALLMAGGVAVVPEVIHTLAQMGTVFVEKTYTDDSLLTIILYVTLALSACFCALASGVLGFRLLRGNRRRARLIAEAVAIGLVVAFSADLLLFGVNPGLWFLGACALILIAAHVWVDPSLSDERELQRRLRLMQTREEAEEGTLGLDKTGRGYIELDFFNLFWIFVIASVAGVVIESIYHVLVVDFGHYEDRAGLLWGPFSPIYGFGAVLMTLALNRFHNAPIPVVFLVSAVIGGAFEYFVSWFMEYAFGAIAWDYTGTFLNINGRTNFMFMCMWGVLGVVWVKLALPALLAHGEPHPVALALLHHGAVRGAHDLRRRHDARGPRLLVLAPGGRGPRQRARAVLRRAVRQPVDGKPLRIDEHPPRCRPSLVLGDFRD